MDAYKFMLPQKNEKLMDTNSIVYCASLVRMLHALPNEFQSHADIS